jgi:hypothetical protein
VSREPETRELIRIEISFCGDKSHGYGILKCYRGIIGVVIGVGWNPKKSSIKALTLPILKLISISPESTPPTARFPD